MRALSGLSNRYSPALSERLRCKYCQSTNAFALRMTPADFNSAAMRRVENPGRSMTNVWRPGASGSHSAQASHPPTARMASNSSVKKVFKLRLV